MAHNIKLYLSGEKTAFELQMFEKWLLRTPAVADQAEIRAVDSKGVALGAVEYIEVVCAMLSTAGAMVSAYGAWKASRRSVPELRIVIDGRPEVRVIEGTAAEAAKVLGLGPGTTGYDEDPSVATPDA